MHTDDFDFELPEDLIAQAPLERRDASRLLHVQRSGGHVHRRFVELPDLLRAGDVLVFNDSRVIPARLLGKKAESGGKVELLLVRPAADVATAEALKANASGSSWLCLGQASKAIRPGMKLEFDGGLTAECEASLGEGSYRVRFTSSLASLEQAIERAGRLPLPPYITRAPGPNDADRYQTIYAQTAGSIAAPTAGLHFTPEVFAALDAKGLRRAFITLDVGPGTFLPVREGPIAAHTMHAERFSISTQSAQLINEATRVIAVGTTVTRTLESVADEDGHVRAGAGETSIFIVPGYRFKAIDALVTNFHLPKSTLVMLVSAFLGREKTLEVYAAAVRERYRFFSYGDSMFLEE